LVQRETNQPASLLSELTSADKLIAVATNDPVNLKEQRKDKN